MNNLFGTSLQNRACVAKMNRRKIELDAFVILISVFITIAVMQSFELSGMLAEAKSIGTDIGVISVKQEVLLERYLK